MKRAGKCTSRIIGGDSNFFGCFVVPAESCNDVILGMYCFREYSGLISVGDHSMAFSWSHPKT